VARIAVSGHRGLAEGTIRLVDQAVRAALRAAGPAVTGLSCLADGADQVFARAVLESGGLLEAVIPARQYRDGLPGGARPEYDRLLAQASAVHELPFAESAPESHMAASRFMVEHADELWAVWDGRPARGYGGTADVVAFARSGGVPVRVIWPQGSSRE
jgi:hypothetical protein